MAPVDPGPVAGAGGRGGGRPQAGRPRVVPDSATQNEVRAFRMVRRGVALVGVLLVVAHVRGSGAGARRGRRARATAIAPGVGADRTAVRVRGKAIATDRRAGVGRVYRRVASGAGVKARVDARGRGIAIDRRAGVEYAGARANVAAVGAPAVEISSNAGE
jgi:hypothetical protein